MAQIQPLLKPIHPEINDGVGITSGLVFDVPMWEGAGQFVQDDTSLLEDLLGTLVGATWDRNLYGIDIDFSAAASAVNYTNSPASMNSLGLISIEAVIYIRSNGGGSLGRIVHKKNNTKGYFALYTQTTTIAFDVGYAVSDAIQTIPQPSLNAWHHLVVTCSNLSNAAGNTNFYLDGVSQTVTNQQSGSGAIVADDTNFYIGNRGDAIRNFDGKILYSRVWNRVITPTEVWALYTNPWVIYKKPNSYYQRLNSIAAAATNVKMQAIRGWSFPI